MHNPTTASYDSQTVYFITPCPACGLEQFGVLHASTRGWTVDVCMVGHTLANSNQSIILTQGFFILSVILSVISFKSLRHALGEAGLLIHGGHALVKPFGMYRPHSYYAIKRRFCWLQGVQCRNIVQCRNTYLVVYLSVLCSLGYCAHTVSIPNHNIEFGRSTKTPCWRPPCNVQTVLSPNYYYT